MFTVQSAQASLTTQVARTLLTWIPINLEAARLFENRLVNLLTKCITPSITSGRTKKIRDKSRAKMWASYHSVRTSDEYQQMWEMFLLNSVKAPIFCPMFCQYMGHHLFRHLVLSQTSFQRCTSQLLTTELTYEELNGLRYAAGYVPRALMKKISRSKDSNRTDILQCLCDLSSDGSEPDNSSSDWINMVNRGGLMCINNITFELFLAMEYELRSHIGAENICKEAASHIKTSEDVLFLWDIISTNWEENVASLF